MTRVVKIGKLAIGGNNPVRIKGMIKSPYLKVDKVIAEAKALKDAGAEAIRLAVKDAGDVRMAAIVKKHVNIPLVADIHFHQKFALAAIDSGYDSIRLNPLNITKEAQVREVAKLAKKNKVSIRVGINSGGFKRNLSSAKAMSGAMVASVSRYIGWLEKEEFFDIMVSLKGSDVCSTIAANRLFAGKFDYPLHLGVTATGAHDEALIKSSIGIGSLLAQGLGNIIRVSLTAPSVDEIRAARLILQALDLRRFGPQVISCPTCSRCGVDLLKIVDELNKGLKDSGLKKNLIVAAMGCVVNGPGEATQADIGVAFGNKKAVIFRKDKMLKNTDDKDVVKDLLGEIKKIWM